MYKVFVKDIPIILSTQKKYNELYKTIPIEEARFKKIIKKIYEGEKIYLNLYHKNPEKLELFLRNSIKSVEAAGGVVENDKNEILFIRRNKKWDLPKGKVEKDETIEEAALREVIEETGIQNLELKEFFRTTYHIFKRDDKFRLKITHWYKMYSNYSGGFKPEIEEGIKKVKWKNAEKTKEALEDSYENIKLLFA